MEPRSPGNEQPGMTTCDAGDSVVLSGIVEHVRFHREDTGYTVMRLKPLDDEQKSVTVVAHLPMPRTGDLYQFTGSWSRHPRYGLQFQATRFEARPPVTADGIRAYLASEIDEIGPELARRIVDAFGMDTFIVIDHEPFRLREVPGIGRKRAEAIIRAWRDHRNRRETFVFLYSQGITAGLAARVYKRYQEGTVEMVRANPYRLAIDIPGVGFLTADRIAEKTGIARDAPERIDAGVVYMLEVAAAQGHTFLPRRILLHEAGRLLGVDRDLIEGQLAELASLNHVSVERDPDGNEAEDAVYHTALERAERHAARDLVALSRAGKGAYALDPEGSVDWMEEQYHLDLSDSQKEAVRCAAAGTCMVLTGGPGTGKTSTITAVLHMFRLADARIVLCAPTGRAARRMTEATGHEASTIHRLLEFNPREGAFKRNEGDPLEADLIIVDEFSMVDIVLLHHFLKAVVAGTTLVFVGDVDQLPSVGPGNCLKDIINSGIVEVVRLDTIFRQELASRIIVNCHRINQGRMPEITENGTGDYRFIPEEDPDRILSEIVRLASAELPDRYGLDPIRDVQVLSPMHKGVLGVENLNRHLQQALNPSGSPYRKGSVEFRVGDKVMQTRNNYELEVFNGDIGTLADINVRDGSFQVAYDDRIVFYAPADADDLVVAYATTIHKAQGSEYPAVLMPIHPQHSVMLARNLLYTAVSRGKRLVVTIGSARAVRLSVENSRSRTRFTRFARRLSGKG
ncbi:MAG TPA: ATP-dependent RecD-like DNA helicase [Deltaproteobacteria bacterium]|nr:ATP-dependent RecD-like DNA helicase [Deltaproteobacteria bacterium]HPR55751.1 ATP-dependent RecD-like DNA helicase [Deltaproteobacteria bacterium]HXK47533.1 ATP-dependent RecD-like DNA helicase [Deltaproteobacteria bacterium]